MNIFVKMMLGVSLFSFGLYASEYTEDDAKKRSAEVYVGLNLLEKHCGQVARLADELAREKEEDGFERAIERAQVVTKERESVVFSP